MREEFEIIFAYSRAQAIADGVLVDVTKTAREAGFRVSVVLTSAVWAECVAWNEKEAAIQDEAGRLWDVVWLASQAARGNRQSDADRLTFELLVVPTGGRRPVRKTLVLHIGPGDLGEPAMTIMLPGED
jgi:hypothetical protein